MEWGINAVLQGWAERLNTPFGYILLIICAIYIFLRVTGRINGISIGKKQETNNNSQPDYILK